MMHRADSRSWSLIAHHLHLLVYARRRLDRRLRSRLDPCDLVQESLLRAHARLDQCHGQSDAQRAAWLQSILANIHAEQLRKALGPLRDISRESSLDAIPEDPTARRQEFLRDEAPTPSQQAVTNEQITQLVQALAQLPEEQRAALDLHHLQSLPVAEVAARMGRTPAAVAGLLRRGLQALRQLLPDLD
jgi:RNA polymerase sigma-70 factor (ECF subfamily)